MSSKVDYVRAQAQTRPHICHWPGCETQVAPAMWGCNQHWFTLPATLRAKVWRAYVPGQELTMTPSREYVAVAREVQDWIKEFLAKRQRGAAPARRPKSIQRDLFDA